MVTIMLKNDFEILVVIFSEGKADDKTNVGGMYAIKLTNCLFFGAINTFNLTFKY